MKKNKIVILFLTALLIISNVSVISSADRYSDFQQITTTEENVWPLFEIIHRTSLDIYDDGVEVMMETDYSTSLQISVTIHQEKGSSWSLLSKKTFSKNSTVLGGKVNCDFQSGVRYRVIANFNAGGEKDTIEKEFVY